MRQTRIIAAVAVLVLAGAIVSDQLAARFWGRHALLASPVSSLLVVVPSVAVVNEMLERRQRRRWSVLAQYVLIELVRTARFTWTELMERMGLMPTGSQTEVPSLDAGAQTVGDTTRLVDAMRELLADPERREQLHELIERLIGRSDAAFGRWAGVMLNSSAHGGGPVPPPPPGGPPRGPGAPAEIIDRHVELYSRLAWVGRLLEYVGRPAVDPRAGVCFHPPSPPRCSPPSAPPFCATPYARPPHPPQHPPATPYRSPCTSSPKIWRRDTAGNTPPPPKAGDPPPPRGGTTGATSGRGGFGAPPLRPPTRRGGLRWWCPGDHLPAVTAFSSSSDSRMSLRQVSLVGLVDPAFERDSEDSDPCLGGQTRGWVADAAPAQRVGDRRGE